MQLEVEKILKSKDVDFKLVELKENAFTVADVIANSVGDINPDEICKTIIVRGKKTSKRYGMLILGTDRLSFSKIKKILNEEVIIANVEEVFLSAQVEPGAVCPFMLTVPLYVDEKVEKLPQINCGSGHHLYGLEFKMKDLKKVIQYEVADLIKNEALN